MALKVKSIDASASKWSDNAGRASAEMATNAVAAASEWQSKTVAAADNYHMAVTSANIKNRFSRGVTAAGAAKYSRKVEAVAASRYSEGVGVAQPDYKSGAEPYFSTLAALSLSARKPRGDPGNIRRVEEVTKALNSKRIAMLGGAGG